MRRASVTTMVMVFGMMLAMGVSRPAPVRAQAEAPLAGRWTLNRELSQFPTEIGFAADWASSGARSVPDSSSGRGGGRGGRRGGGSGGGATGNFQLPHMSADESKRALQLTDEVRTPSPHLTIVDTMTAVTITDDLGRSRTFRPDGKDDVVQLDGVTAPVAARREGNALIVVYHVQQGRDLRYTYTRTANPAQLIVDVEFIERTGGDKVRRVYQPASETETTAVPSGTTPASGASAPANASGGAGTSGNSGSAGSAGAPATGAGAPSGGSVPATGDAASQPFNQQPDAELKGLTQLGLVVEDLGQEAEKCGLTRSGLETAIATRLSDAGLKVLRNTDEDTYLYVDITTASLSTGTCVSRYDAYLYTHTTAKLSYQSTPVLVQVSLLHQGGITGGASARHGADVTKRLQDYVDQFATRIRDANK